MILEKQHRVGRLHPLPFWKGRGLGSGLRTPSSQEGDRGVEKNLRYDHRRKKVDKEAESFCVL